MAQKVTVQLVDDLDDSPITPGEGRTVEFAFDGRPNEIDLTDDNVDKFREAISDYVAAARKVSGRRSAPVAPHRSRRRSGATPRNSERSRMGEGETATRSRAVAASPRRCAGSVRSSALIALSEEPGRPRSSGFLLCPPQKPMSNVLSTIFVVPAWRAAQCASLAPEATTWNEHRCTTAASDASVEDRAAAWLEDHGFRLVERNWRLRTRRGGHHRVAVVHARLHRGEDPRGHLDRPPVRGHHASKMTRFASARPRLVRRPPVRHGALDPHRRGRRARRRRPGRGRTPAVCCDRYRTSGSRGARRGLGATDRGRGAPDESAAGVQHHRVADTSLGEARERVRAARANAGCPLPPDGSRST